MPSATKQSELVFQILPYEGFAQLQKENVICVWIKSLALDVGISELENFRKDFLDNRLNKKQLEHTVDQYVRSYTSAIQKKNKPNDSTYYLPSDLPFQKDLVTCLCRNIVFATEVMKNNLKKDTLDLRISQERKKMEKQTELVGSLINSAQALLLGIEKKEKIIDEIISYFMRILSFIYPVSVLTKESSEDMKEILKQSILYKYSEENIISYLKCFVIKEIIHLEMNPSLSPVSPLPSILTNEIKTLSLTDSLAREVQFQLKEDIVDSKIRAAWQPLHDWAENDLDKYFKTSIYRWTIGLILVLGGATFYGYRTGFLNSIVGGLIFLYLLINLSKVCYSLWYYTNILENKKFKEYIKLIFNHMQNKMIELKEKKIITSLEDIEKINRVLTDLFQPASNEGGISFFKYKNTFPKEDWKRFEPMSDDDNIGAANETSHDLSSKDIVYFWADAMLCSTMEAILEIVNRERCFLLLDIVNLTQQADKARRHDALKELLAVDPELVGPKAQKGIKELKSPIPGTAKINGKKFDVTYTHKVKDPGTSFRIMCYSLKSQDKATLLVGCLFRDDHGKENKIKELHAKDLSIASFKLKSE